MLSKSLNSKQFASLTTLPWVSCGGRWPSKPITEQKYSTFQIQVQSRCQDTLVETVDNKVQQLLGLYSPYSVHSLSNLFHLCLHWRGSTDPVSLHRKPKQSQVEPRRTCIRLTTRNHLISLKLFRVAAVYWLDQCANKKSALAFWLVRKTKRIKIGVDCCTTPIHRTWLYETAFFREMSKRQCCTPQW